MVKNPPSFEGDLSSIPGQGTKIPHAMEQPSPSATTREPKCCNEDPAQPKFLNKKDRESSKISTVFVRRKKVCVNRHTQVGRERVARLWQFRSLKWGSSSRFSVTSHLVCLVLGPCLV